MVEVVGSSPISSTSLLSPLLRTWHVIGFTLGGLVAAEGSFVITIASNPFADGTPRLRFVFQLAMAGRDALLLEALRRFLGCGSIYQEPSRRPHWQPTVILTIASRRAHHAATIPFAERYLMPCHKQRQFEQWRDALRSYEVETRAYRPKRGRSICRMPGCDKPVRGRMLCRSHYYRETGY